MWQTFIFGMHWSHGGKMYYDELLAGSSDEARESFNTQKRSDVTLVRVELIGPDNPGVREYAHSPISPFSPLKARRKLDQDEDAR
jgi:hypothetical protein